MLDRFGQIAPKVLVAAEGYYYGGKTFDQLPKVKEILAKLPSVEKTVIVGYTREKADLAGVPNALHYADFVAPKSSGIADYAGVFAVTAGIGLKAVCDRFRAEHDDYNAIMAEAG